MNQEKIGKYIGNKRKTKKLTQKQLSENMNISEKTVSKWECGKGLPDVTLMQPLCNELDITLNELLNGEDDKEKPNNKGYIDYIKHNNKKNKRNIFIIILTSILSIALLVLGIYFVNNYGKVRIYHLSGWGEHFYYNSGMLILSQDKTVFVSGTLMPLSAEVEALEIEDYISMTIRNGGDIIKSAVYLGDSSLTTEEKGYNEIFSGNEDNYLKDWKYEIQFILGEEIITEIIDIKVSEITINNKWFYKTVDPIGLRDQNKYDVNEYFIPENQYQEILKLREMLLTKGFKKSSTDSFELIKETKSKGVTETITVSTSRDYITYKREEAKNNYINIGYNYGDYGVLENNKNKLKEINITQVTSEERYEYKYIPVTEELICEMGECPNSVWQEARDFYKYSQELLNIKENNVQPVYYFFNSTNGI